MSSLGGGLHVASHWTALLVGKELRSGQGAARSADVPWSVPGLGEVWSVVEGEGVPVGRCAPQHIAQASRSK